MPKSTKYGLIILGAFLALLIVTPFLPAKLGTVEVVRAFDLPIPNHPEGFSADCGEDGGVANVLKCKDPVQGGEVVRTGLVPIISTIGSVRGMSGFILGFILSFVGVVSLFILVVSGFRYITSFGGDTAKAKQGIATVIIGIVIIIGAWAVVTTVINFGAGPPI